MTRGRIIKPILRVSLLLCGIFYAGRVVYASQVEAVYFYSVRCAQCRYVSENVIPEVKNKYGGNLSVKMKEIGAAENLRLLLEYEKRVGRKINKKPPVIFVGTDVLQGKNEITEKLDTLIALHLKSTTDSSKVVVQDTNDSPPKDAIAAQFRGLGIFAVITGGLIDGINPCAFTTLIFLISYLAFIGRRRRQLIRSGLSYTLGVFTAYMGIGLGLFGFMSQISMFPLVAKIISILIAIVVCILGVLSVYDFIQIRRGRTKNVTLQLSAFWKKRIHSSIRERSKSSSHITASFTLGFLIGLFEFPCTGQVYLPIVIVIREISTYRTQALFYLLLYNLLFILPLLAVFAVAYWGVSSDTLAKFMKKRMALIKILTAIFFFATAGFIMFINIF
jgi:cytochrome c biogenesis protein CcdA